MSFAFKRGLGPRISSPLGPKINKWLRFFCFMLFMFFFGWGPKIRIFGNIFTSDDDYKYNYKNEIVIVSNNGSSIDSHYFFVKINAQGIGYLERP